MKKYFSNKKILLALCLAGAALVAAAGGTLAIYTNQTYQRSVVRHRDNEGIRFSSDKLYLETYSETVGTAQKYHYPMGENQRYMAFQVCNYDQSKSSLINEDTINYTITFVTDAAVEIYRGDKRIETDSRSSLNGGERSVDIYKIVLPEDYEDVEVSVKVTPDDPGLTQNHILSAVLIPIRYGTVQNFSVKKEFPDKGTDISNVAAYNVLVSAVGSGKAYIQWNSEKLDIDYYFKAHWEDEGYLVKPVEDAPNYSCITIPMNSMDGTGSLLITFYNRNNSSWEDWNALEITVSDASQ